MRRYWLTCPLWVPELPPPPADQFGTFNVVTWNPAQCAFANPADGGQQPPYVDGTLIDQDPAEMGRNYRCIQHNRRPTIHQRSWNAESLRHAMMRVSGRMRTIRLTDREDQIAIYPRDYRPYPEDWPHARRHYGTIIWIASRPAPPTMHSTW